MKRSGSTQGIGQGIADGIAKDWICYGWSALNKPPSRRTPRTKQRLERFLRACQAVESVFSTGVSSDPYVEFFRERMTLLREEQRHLIGKDITFIRETLEALERQPAESGDLLAARHRLKRIRAALFP